MLLETIKLSTGNPNWKPFVTSRGEGVTLVSSVEGAGEWRNSIWGISVRGDFLYLKSIAPLNVLLRAGLDPQNLDYQHGTNGVINIYIPNQVLLLASATAICRVLCKDGYLPSN